MTVPSPTDKNRYVATGSNSSYQYSFRILQATDLIVQTEDTSGNVTTLVYLTDYTVAGVSQYSGGSITLTAGNLTAGVVLLLFRDPAALQNTSLQTQGAYDAKSVETALDLLTMIDQAQNTRLDRSAHGPDTDITSMLLPSSALRASKYFAFDSMGNATVTNQIPSVVSFVDSVLNVGALKALTVPIVNTVYATTGYYTNGDGGEGFYFWNSSDSRTDNGGTIIQLNAGGTGRFNLIAENFVNVRQFGAKGDSTTDDATALQSAITARVGMSLLFPAGTYKISTGLINTSTALLGDNEDAGDSGFGVHTVIIKPSSGVAIALTMNGGKLSNICFDGTNTSGKIGVLVGSVLCANFSLNNVTIQKFGGASGIGLKLRQIVSVSFYNMYLLQNALNVFVSPEAGDSTPTTCWFHDSAFRSSTIDEGVTMFGGFSINFTNCVFENNKKEGFKILTSSGSNTLYGSLTNCWFEGNWAGAAVPTNHYQCVVDGTTGGAGGAGAFFDNVFFNGSPTSSKSISLNKVIAVSLAKVIPPLGAGVQILVSDASSLVTIPDNSGRIDLVNALSNPDAAHITMPTEAFDVGTLWPPAQAWTPWTPSYSTFAAMVYGTITTDVARYKLIGKTLHLELMFHGTTSGVASSGIIVSLPTGVPQFTGLLTPCTITNVGTIETGYVQTGGSDGIYFRRAASANFGIGANTGGSISLTIELS